MYFASLTLTHEHQIFYEIYYKFELTYTITHHLHGNLLILSLCDLVIIVHVLYSYSWTPDVLGKCIYLFKFLSCIDSKIDLHGLTLPAWGFVYYHCVISYAHIHVLYKPYAYSQTPDVLGKFIYK